MNTNKAILPSSYFPPASHFVVMNMLDTNIELNENYQKRSIRNRCSILAANGPLHLSVPLLKGRTKQLMKNVRISYAENWMSNHCKSIRSAYGTSPYYDFYFESICTIINSEYQYLHELNHHILLYFNELGLIPEFSYSQEFIPNDQFDGFDLRAKNCDLQITSPEYEQVFGFKFGFVQNLSILDLLFNLGPETIQWLRDSKLNV
ncbi:MAG: hypothetical protein HKN67_03440 [Saprospiraceae bacterium]|nr:hypothetical protein [Saprospiraceae bacterium]